MDDEVNTSPVYRIQTSRLILRCYNPSDAPLLIASATESKDHLLPWMPWAAEYPIRLEKAVERMRLYRGNFDHGKDFVYGVFSPDEKQLIGGTGLHTRHGMNVREIGYWIHKDFVRQGLATELAAALTKVAFIHDKVERVEIHCDSRNTASAGVPRNLGFTHEAILRRRSPAIMGGPPGDTMIWTMLPEEFSATPCAAAEIEAYDAIGQRIEL
ncbi:MAG: GNAT family N-acetyltransferase [bacterium]|nr:GNAT family N-acetyltransferase [bacterium]